jgi:hypothetical protein
LSQVARHRRSVQDGVALGCCTSGSIHDVMSTRLGNSWSPRRKGGVELLHQRRGAVTREVVALPVGDFKT